MHYLNSLGITAWLDPLADAPILKAYRDLSEHGELTAHVAAFPEVKAKTDEGMETCCLTRSALRKWLSLRTSRG